MIRDRIGIVHAIALAAAFVFGSGISARGPAQIQRKFKPPEASPSAPGLDLGSIADALRMDGVAGFVEGRAREAVGYAVSREGSGWICDSLAEAINRRRRGERGMSISELFMQDESLRIEVKEGIEARLRGWLPGRVRDLVARDLFGAVAGEEAAAEAQAIAERVVREIDVGLNDRIDLAASQLYDAALDGLRREMSGSGIPAFVDVTDLRGSIDRALNATVLDEAACDTVAGLIGDGAAAGIRGRIADALGGRLPPELVDAMRAGPSALDRYVAEFGQYLPGAQLRGLAGSVLNSPVFDLPTPAYASILAASAAAHFARAYGGVYVDPQELKRGVEVTRVMVWQIQNKDSIGLSIMQLSSLARGLASRLGAGDMLAGALDRVREPLDRIQGLADRIDAMMLRPLGEVSAELRSLAEDLRRELEGIQDLVAAPIRDGLQGVTEWAKDILPEGLDGIPRTWGEAREMLGIPDDLLGGAGELTPRDLIGDIARRTGLDEVAGKVRDDLEELGGAVSDAAAEGASRALYGLHLIGPAAAIAGAEGVPARNPSEVSALDPVFLHSGEYFQEVTDLVIPGRGIDFRFTRIYRGRSDFLGELGWRWTHSFAERLRPWRGGLTYIDVRGRKHFFRREGAGFVPPPGLGASLECAGEGCSLVRIDGIATSFDPEGRPLSRCDRHRNCIAYGYGEGGLLSSVTDSMGRRIEFKRRSDGLIEELRDFAGRAIAFEYNESKELIGVTSPRSVDFPQGKKTSYRYADAGGNEHLISMIMSPGGDAWLSLRYDGEGRVTRQRYGDSPWMTVRYAKGSGGVAQRAWVTDRLGRTICYEHDAAGHLLARWLYEGGRYGIIEYSRYDDSGNILSRCLPSGRCTAYRYGAGPNLGPTVVAEYPSGGGRPRVMRMGYEPRYGQVARIEYASGAVEEAEYSDDAAADLVSIRRSAGTGGERREVARFTYDAWGRLLSESDGGGRAASFEYYPGGGYLRRIVDGEGRAKASFEYDAVGNIIAQVDGDGRRTRYLVNSLNQTLRSERDGAPTIGYAFDADDDLLSATIERGGYHIVQEFGYGDLGRLVSRRQQVSPGVFAETRYEYDAGGRLMRIVKPEGNAVAYEYDELDRLLCVVRGAGSDVESRECIERDVDGEVVAHIDGSGVRTRYELDGFGERVAEVDALGNRTEYVRGAAGRIVAVRRLGAGGELLAEERIVYDADRAVALKRRLWRDDPKRSRWVEVQIKDDGTNRTNGIDGMNGVRVDREYDDMGRLVSLTRGGISTERYEWDGNGRLTAAVDANGNRIRYSYDAQDRIAVEGYVDGSERRYSYDGAGRVVGVVGRDGTGIEIEYDAAGRLASRRAVAGERTATQRFEHDGMGRLTLASDDAAPTGAIASRFLYDSLSRPYGESMGGGWLMRAYDDAGRVVSMRYPSGESYQYVRDGGGRISAVLGPRGRLASFDRDVSGRLARADLASRLTLDIERDEGGMELARRYSDRNGREVARWRMERDGFGRIEQMADSLEGVTRRYARDAAGRLMRVDGGAGWRYELDAAGNVLSESHGGKRASFRYDALGRIEGYEYDGSGRLVGDGPWRFEYDPWGRLEQVYLGTERYAWYRYDAFDRRVHQQVADISHELSWDGWRLAAVEASGDRSRSFVHGEGIGAPLISVTAGYPSILIADTFGSVRGIDGIDNDLSARCDYSPYGRELGCDHFAGIFGFAGQVRGIDGRLSSMRHRDYDPASMRFLEPDPLGIKMPHRARGDVAVGPLLSYHSRQGLASAASVPNRPLRVSATYGIFPFDMISAQPARARGGELNLYQYASADPSTYLDPFGLASLVLDRGADTMTLVEGDGWELTDYHASNRTTNPLGDPMVPGSHAPFPAGSFALGVPQFYSEEYREEFYERFGLGEMREGESEVVPYRWDGTWSDGYNVSQGRIRMRAGAPTEGLDRLAWQRQLFIHGGRYNDYSHVTQGCIRARDDELETLAANFIAFRRQGDPIDTLVVK